MNSKRRILLAGAVVFAAAGCGGGDDGDKNSASGKDSKAARATLEKLEGATTAKRASALRGLRFTDGAPELNIVTPEETTDYIRSQAQRNYPDARLVADEAFYQLSGIIPANTSLRALVDKFSGSLILGYYDRENPDKLNMVTNTGAKDPKAAESTLAHELNHGLQDQNFGLKRIEDIKDPERSSAASGLVEGDSQVLELLYGKKYLGGEPKASASTGGLPLAFLLYATFPYDSGAKFVAALVKKGHGYKLVDQAWRKKLPETTEQILHPEKYLSGEKARPVRPTGAKALGDAWKSSGAQTFGELDAAALLSTKQVPKGARGKAVGKAVEGWDGGVREVFTRGDDRALVVATTWESVKEAHEFAAAYARSLLEDRGGKESGRAIQIQGVGFAAVTRNGRDVTLAVAPDAKLASKLAKGR